MSVIDISTDEGVFTADLSNYETVRRLHGFILSAIRGHDPATPSAHPMPPRGPLEPPIIDMFAQLITDGMPERRS